MAQADEKRIETIQTYNQNGEEAFSKDEIKNLIEELDEGTWGPNPIKGSWTAIGWHENGNLCGESSRKITTDCW